MYMLTKEQGNLESGTYASVDDDGTTIVQFFVREDDAIMYRTMLEAIGQEISVTEINSDLIDKLTGALGYAYTIVDEGEMVIPRFETLQHALVNSTLSDDHF